MKRRISVRFGERELMLLRELTELTDSKISELIRMFVVKGLDEITDPEGNLKPLGHATHKTRDDP